MSDSPEILDVKREERGRRTSELRLLQPTLPSGVQLKNDLAVYQRLMARDDFPAAVSPTIEFQWVAFQMGATAYGPISWDTAPSKSAITWLRRMRITKELRKKFWLEQWTYYMENRLALELRAMGPKPPRGGVKGQRGKSNSELADSMEKMISPS